MCIVASEVAERKGPWSRAGRFGAIRLFGFRFPWGPSKKARGLYPGTVAEHGGARSAAATAVGWLIVLIVGWIVLRIVVGTLGWAFRGILVLVALLFLLNLYFRLKARDD